MYLDLIKNNDIEGVKAEIKKLKDQSDNLIKQAEQQLASIQGATAVLQGILDDMQKPTESVQDQE